MNSNHHKIIYLICCLSIICGIFIGGVYLYQKWQQSTKKTTQTIVKSPQLPKIKPTSKIPFDPKIPKPTYYMGKIQGTLTYYHSLKIAQEYYDKGAYENAIIWAYRANQINSNDINSWKIYTASLRKLGKEKEANELMQNAQKYFKKNAK